MIFDSDSFFYAISDINNNLNIAVKYELEGDPSHEIPKIIEKETLAVHYYSSVNVFSKFNLFTLIPSSEYSYGNEPALVRNSFQQNGGQLSTDFSAKEGINIIHSYPDTFKDALSTLGSNQNFRHISLAYLESDAADGVYITLNTESMVILVRVNSKLLYYNQFTTATSEDRLYFIMLVYDQLNLIQSENVLYLTGPMEAKKELHQLLSNYIAHISEDMNTFTNMKGKADDIHDLYLASICE